MTGGLRSFPDRPSLFRAAAELLAERAEQAVREAGCFTLVLSGGSTPRELYSLLAGPSFASRIPWSRIRFYWGDERFVAHSHPASNFRLARETLLAHVPIAEENVHPMPTDAATPRRGARRYEGTLRALALEQGRFPPRFDLVLLGLGADGHTASLFPGGPECAEHRRWCVASRAPRGVEVRRRITLTLPVLNAARCVVFLVAGLEKREALRKALRTPEQKRSAFPAQLVRPEGELWWLTDFPP